MADETLRSRGADIDHDDCDVSTLASQVTDWGMVSQYGLSGTNRLVLRNGHLPTDTLLRDGLYGTTWTMAISEFVRGCGFL